MATRTVNQSLSGGGSTIQPKSWRAEYTTNDVETTVTASTTILTTSYPSTKVRNYNITDGVYKNYIAQNNYIWLDYDGTAYQHSFGGSGWEAGTVTLTKSGTKSISASSYFNSSNKYSKSVSIPLIKITNTSLQYFTYVAGGNLHGSGAGQVLCYWQLTLNAPPTFDSTNVTLSGPPYAGYATATATVSNLSAKYGGDISSAVLKIGSQTATRTSNGSFTPFTLTTAGTFTPTVTVTDSRGQTTTKNLASITILPYVAPNCTFSVERTTSAGVPNDEGESAVITATFTYTDAVASLTAPTIAVKDTDNITVTPTITWYADRALTDAISDWSSVASGAEVYALLGNDVFDTQDSYQISLTPNDIDIKSVAHSGTAITQTLGSAFYTVDFRAGGHGIAFGQACTADGFYCNMDAWLYKNVLFGLDTTSASGTDHDLYAAITALGWQSEVIV